MSTHEVHQLGQFIPLHYHYQMLRDDARVLAFKSALDKAVPAGGRVLELGSGTGVLSFFAAQRAGSVCAVEYNPALVSASQKILEQNGVADRVQVICGDAATFTPDEPVDLVVCEMLHSALLREKQLAVIGEFKRRYQARFGALPRFMPEATVLAAQPLFQNYDFHGYRAAVPFFQDAASESPESVPAADAQVYAMIDYTEPLPQKFEARQRFVVAGSASINAVRFITKNLLAILPEEHRSIDWYNQSLVLPLPAPVQTQAGNVLEICFAYEPGAPIEMLSESLRCELVAS